MAKRTDWAVNVDKLRVCFTMPENLYSYLNEHYTRYDELTNARILDEDDFNLVFIEGDETKMSAIVQNMKVRRSLPLRTEHCTEYIRECRTESRLTISVTCCM